MSLPELFLEATLLTRAATSRTRVVDGEVLCELRCPYRIQDFLLCASSTYRKIQTVTRRRPQTRQGATLPESSPVQNGIVTLGTTFQ
jgi:hypothetical protein